MNLKTKFINSSEDEKSKQLTRHCANYRTYFNHIEKMIKISKSGRSKNIVSGTREQHTMHTDLSKDIIQIKH